MPKRLPEGEYRDIEDNVYIVDGLGDIYLPAIMPFSKMDPDDIPSLDGCDELHQKLERLYPARFVDRMAEAMSGVIDFLPPFLAEYECMRGGSDADGPEGQG